MFPARKRSSSSRRGSRSKRTSRSRSRSHSRSSRRRKSEGGKPPVTTPPVSNLVKYRAEAMKLLSEMGGSEEKLKAGEEPLMRVYDDTPEAADQERRDVHDRVFSQYKPKPIKKLAEMTAPPQLAIMTTAPVETMAAVRSLLNLEFWVDKQGGWYYYLGALPGTKWKVPVVVVKSDQSASGTHGAGQATTALLDKFPSVRALIAVGICWGVKEVRLGDVIVSSAIQNYDHKMVKQGKSTLSRPLYEVNSLLLRGLRMTENGARVGLFACSTTLYDDKIEVEKVIAAVNEHCLNHTLLGGEMEAIGMVDAAASRRIPVAVVKAVVDDGGATQDKDKSAQPAAAVAAMDHVIQTAGNADSNWVRNLLPMNEFLEVKREDFVGRKGLFDAVKASTSPLTVIEAGPGAGKSSFLAEFHFNNCDSVVSVHVCRFGLVDTLDPRGWVESIGWQTVQWARRQGIDVPANFMDGLKEEDDVGKVFQSVLSVLPQSWGGGEVAWMLVDSLDEAVAEGGSEIVRAIGRAARAKAIPGWLRVLVTSRPEEEVKKVLGKGVHVIELDKAANNEVDIRTWLGKKSRAGLSPSEVDAIVKASKGQFLYVRQLVRIDDLSEVIEKGKLPKSLDEVYAAQFEGAWEREQEFSAHVAPVLAVLSAAQAAVSATMISAAGEVLRAFGTSDLLKRLEQLGVLDRGVDGSARFFHKSVVEWAERLGAHGKKVEVEDGHRGLAAAGMKMWEKGDVYAIRFTPYHGRKGEKEVEVLHKVGLKWEWMKKKALIDGWAAVGDDLIALGGDGKKIGKVVKQRSGLGVKGVGFWLSLHGGEEMKKAIEGDLGLVPCCGGIEVEEYLEMSLVGHEDFVWCVADAGGGRIVTGGSDRTLKVWDVHSGKGLMTLEGHAEWVYAIVVVGGRVISGSIDGTLIVWDLENGECKQVVEHGGHVYGLCVIDERTIVSCGLGGAVFVLKIGEDGELKNEKELKGHSGYVDCVIALGDGRVASGGYDRVILVHDVESGDVNGKLEGHTDEVKDLAVLADGRLVSASDDKTLRVWSSNYTGEAEMVLEGHESDVMAVTLLGNGMIASGDRDGWLRLWSVERSSWKALGEIKAPTRGISGLQTLDGGRFVSVGDDGHVALWDVSRFDGEKQQAGHKSNVTCGAVLNDGRIVSGGESGDIVVWKKPERGKENVVEQVIEGRGSDVMDLVTTSNGFAWCDDGGSTFLWEEGSDGPVRLEFYSTRLCSVGRGSILVGLDGDKVNFYDIQKEKLLNSVELGDRVGCITPLDSKRVAVGGLTGRVFVVNVVNGNMEKEQLIGSSEIRKIVFAGGGKLTVANWIHELWLWEKKGAPEKLLDGVREVFVSLGDSKVVLKTTDGGMILWDSSANEREVEFGGLNGRDVNDVAWDASRRLVVFFLSSERCWVAYKL